MWGSPPKSSGSAFYRILVQRLSVVAQQGPALNGGLIQTVVPSEEDPTVIVQNANASDPLGAMLDMVVAQRMIEANTRLIRTGEKVADTMTHLGELPWEG